MKKYVKFLTIIVIFVMMIGINVNAEDYYLYSDRASIDITIPIHKTDINKKPLEGAIFTLKDFNNTISHSSSYEGDGDYLIEVHSKNVLIGKAKRENTDQEFKIDDEYSNDNTLMKILDIIPSKYSDVIKNAQSADDLYDMLDLPITYSDSYDGGYYVEFFVPLKIEESKVPAGYKTKNIIVPVYVFIGFDDYRDDNYGYIRVNLASAPGSYGRFGVPAYFEYSDGVDYVALFDKINNELFESDYNETIEVFEKNGAIIDDDCDIDEELPVSREDIEERFSDDIEEYLCPINLVDEKEDIIVNPETAGTIGIVALLLVIGLSVIFYTRRVKSN